MKKKYEICAFAVRLLQYCLSVMLIVLKGYTTKSSLVDLLNPYFNVRCLFKGRYEQNNFKSILVLIGRHIHSPSHASTLLITET